MMGEVKQYPDAEALRLAARAGEMLLCHVPATTHRQCPACLGAGWLRPCAACGGEGTKRDAPCIVCGALGFTAGSDPELEEPYAHSATGRKRREGVRDV